MAVLESGSDITWCIVCKYFLSCSKLFLNYNMIIIWISTVMKNLIFLLLNQHDTDHQKTICDWISDIQCSNTHAKPFKFDIYPIDVFVCLTFSFVKWVSKILQQQACPSLQFPIRPAGESSKPAKFWMMGPSLPPAGQEWNCRRLALDCPLLDKYGTAGGDGKVAVAAVCWPGGELQAQGGLLLPPDGRVWNCCLRSASHNIAWLVRGN